MLLKLKPLRMLLMLLLHKPKLRALLQVVLATVAVLPTVVVLVIEHPRAVAAVIVLLQVAVLPLHLLMEVVTLLGLELRIIHQQRVIGMVMTCTLIQNSDLLLKNIRVLFLFIEIRTHSITE